MTAEQLLNASSNLTLTRPSEPVQTQSDAQTPEEDGIVGEDAHPLRERVLPAVRRHLPFLVVLVAGGVLRVATSIAYQPGLEYAQDSFSYLYDAHHGVPNVIRPEGYAFFLRLVEGLSEQFSMVFVVQHGFGLAMGVMLYVLLYRIGAGRWLAALGAAPVLLDSYQVYIEQFVLSETLFAFLTVVAAVLLLWPSQRWMEARVAAAGVALGLGTVTRTVGIALLIGTALFLVLRRSGWRLCLAFFLPVGLIVGGYGLWFKSVHGSFGLERYHGYTLAARVSPFADCRGLDLPPDQELFCDPRPPAKRPGADVYLWSERAPLRSRDGVPGPVRDESAARFGRRIIRHQPLDYVRTVVGNLWHYFAPGDPVGPKDNSVRPLQFLTSYTPSPWHPLYPPADPYNTNWTWPKGVKNQVIPARWGFDLKKQAVQVNAPLARRLRQYQQVGRTPGPLLALALLVAVAPALQRVGQERRYVRAGALLLAALGLLVLVIPSAFGTLDYRYRLPALVLLPPAGALGLALARGRVRRRKASQPRGAHIVRAPRRPSSSPVLEPSVFDLDDLEAQVGARSAGS
ncbi:MAG TPA: hypothetical protein VK988_14865 [Acidimicrobiales bacterium]|nr:hypothetical protein [Acidimicrobiales bacterium]